ncbi:MAG: hypothetical protein QNJ46_32825 [Leptolyngbyaceae cyanobacterium MO_188.B28]|nr:hypothetical protein [Leptolyngbyaceae cyanobacterium MO_188.B28]
MNILSSQDRFLVLNFVSQITVCPTWYKVHFVNNEYWTGSLVRHLLALANAGDRLLAVQISLATERL